MKIDQIKTDDLVPYAQNPRHNDNVVDGLAASIKEFGFQQPIVVDTSNTIICGHARYKAARKLKLKTVPCVVAAKLTKAQIKAYRIIDNKLAEAATWNADLLGIELEAISDLDYSFEPFGVELVAEVPDFQPTSEDEQGKLDEKKKVECPSCGALFET